MLLNAKWVKYRTAKHITTQFQNKDITLTPVFEDNYFCTNVLNREGFSNQNIMHIEAVNPQHFFYILGQDISLPPIELSPKPAVQFSVLETKNTYVSKSGPRFCLA